MAGNVVVYFGDERCVPPDDDESNYRMARRAFSMPSESRRQTFTGFAARSTRAKPRASMRRRCERISAIRRSSISFCSG